MVLRLLDLARASGLKFHFFVSARVLRAFPAAADAILGEGHDLDWLCLDPSLRGYEAASEEFWLIGHKAVGVAFKAAFPEGLALDWFREFQFASCRSCESFNADCCFPASSPSDLEAIRSGAGLRAWADTAKTALSRGQDSGGVILLLHPGLQALFDAKLHHLRDVCEFAMSQETPVISLRDAIKNGRKP